MAYLRDAYPFPMDHQPQSSMYFQHPVHYAPYLQQPQPHPDMLFANQHPFQDYVDFMPMGMMHDDYDDNAEVSTRPRLTKEQVEVLEAQFQAHPKPNSMVKKQLALQTKLTLPRVANWFQNRRAKAKQQRKQEEFETSQGLSTSGGWKNEANSGTKEPISKTSSPARCPSARDEQWDSIDRKSPSKSPAKSESRMEASWASLRRHAGLLNLSQSHKPQEQRQNMLAMPPPERPTYVGRPIERSGSSNRAHTTSVSPLLDWTHTQNITTDTSPETVPVSASTQDLGFDFGFDQDVSTASKSASIDHSPEDNNQQYVMSSDDWTETFTAQTISSTLPVEFSAVAQASPLLLPRYPGSRRGSSADELTANLGTFALNGTPPTANVHLNHLGTSIRSTDGEIDIASRRRRPRPAALASSSLRSRSYGQLSSASPASKAGPPSGNVLRHVKSTGHNLNSHYAGIRKSSLPHKSPVSLASFAESESLKRLMAQQGAALSSKTPLTTSARADVGISAITHDFTAPMGPPVEDAPIVSLSSDLLARYQNLQSPPHTPFQTEYMLQGSALAMPPPSMRGQYASFAEYTPPYSAGPLTNSTCWSDGPLQSPDVAGFPAGHFMSPLAFPTHQEAAVQQWVIPSDTTNEAALHHNVVMEDGKKTEFFITEFPGQKEEYASIAQHVSPPKQKNYVFANTAASDYDG